MRQYVEVHRRRQAARGLKRVEVSVQDTDSDLIRRLGKALAGNDTGAATLRAALDKALAQNATASFQQWISSPDEETA